jgi:hypothetical protein
VLHRVIIALLIVRDIFTHKHAEGTIPWPWSVTPFFNTPA